MEQSRKEKLDDIKQDITKLKDDISSLKDSMKELKEITLNENFITVVKQSEKELSEEATSSWFWS